VATLLDVSGRCLEDLISYLYTGKLGLTVSSAVDLRAAAEHLGIPAAAELCRTFVVAEVEKEADSELRMVRSLSDTGDRTSDTYGAGSYRNDNFTNSGSLRVSFIVSA
jgi:hypothetical protein